MTGRHRTFEKIDKSHTTPGFRPLPGESGAVEISEVNFKQCAFLYSPDESCVAFVGYDTIEEEIFPKITQTLLAPKKKSSSTAPGLDLHYKDSPAGQKLVQMKLDKKDDLSIMFALDSIKSKLQHHPIDALEISMHGNVAFDFHHLDQFLYPARRLDLKIPILRIQTTMPDPAIHDLFDYEHLIYRTSMENIHYLYKKMMRCKYLCIQARIKSPSLLSGFQGWGLHLMTVQDGLDLTFVTKEIKNWCSGEKVSRKLTALTREEPDPQPWLLDEQELAEILRMFEDAKIDSWISVDGNFTNRVYTKSNGTQAAVIVESKEEGRFNSLVFMQPYDVVTYKFIRGGQTSYFK